MQPPPAEPGMHEQEVDTPALLLDLDAFEANLDAMAAALAPRAVAAHRETGERVVFLQGQSIVLAQGAQIAASLPLSTSNVCTNTPAYAIGSTSLALATVPTAVTMKPRSCSGTGSIRLRVRGQGIQPRR